MKFGATLAVWMLLSAVTANAPAGTRGDHPTRRASHARMVGQEIESVIQPKQLARPPAAPPASPPMQPAAPLPAPVPITSCDSNGCRDSSGTRYNGAGPGMLRSDGKLCQQVGNMMQCN